MRFIFKNIISGKKYKLEEMEQTPVFIDTVNSVEYTIKKILSSLNLDKYNKNVIDEAKAIFDIAINNKNTITQKAILKLLQEKFKDEK